MVVTRILYTGDGFQRDFTFPFPYIRRQDVIVSVNDAAQTVTVDYTYQTDNSIRFTNAPASGAIVQINRQTRSDETDAVFQEGTGLKAGDLNSNFLQFLYLIQEAFNGIAGEVGPPGPPGATAFRGQTVVTPTVGNGLTENGTITLPKSCILISVGVTSAGWFRLYNNAAAAAADVARLRAVPPALGSGVIADPVFASAGTIRFEPAPNTVNREDPVTTTYPFRFTNDGSSGVVTITLTYLSLET